MARHDHEVELIGTTKKVTDKAVLIEFADGEVWLPLSLVEEYPEVDEEGNVQIPYWLAMDKELI